MQLSPFTLKSWHLGALALSAVPLAPVATQAGEVLSPRAVACIASALGTYPIGNSGAVLDLHGARMGLQNNGDITFTSRAAGYAITGAMAWKGEGFSLRFNAESNTGVRIPHVTRQAVASPNARRAQQCGM